MTLSDPRPWPVIIAEWSDDDLKYEYERELRFRDMLHTPQKLAPATTAHMLAGSLQRIEQYKTEITKRKAP